MMLNYLPRTVWPLLAAMLITNIAVAATPRDPGKHFFQETFGDFKEELATAKAEGKKGVMIFFELDECPWCHRMKTTVLNQPVVQEYYRKNFKIFTVDIEGDIEMVDFQGNTTTQKDFSFKQYKVRATPVIGFFDLEGEMVVRHTGPTSGVEEFMWLGEFMAQGAYKDKNFTRYKRGKRRQSGNS